jgi:hypothetical protein
MCDECQQHIRIYAEVSMNNWNHVPRYLTNNYSEILERGNFDTLTHMYVTSHFPEFVHALQ